MILEKLEHETQWKRLKIQSEQKGVSHSNACREVAATSHLSRLAGAAILAHRPHRLLAGDGIGVLAEHELGDPRALGAVLGARLVDIRGVEGEGRSHRWLEDAVGAAPRTGVARRAEGGAECLSGEGGRSAGVGMAGEGRTGIGEVVRVRVGRERGIRRHGWIQSCEQKGMVSTFV
jgi:hypothetical protein